MTLTPISKRLATPTFDTSDPEFNHRAAQAAYDMVMKMAPEEAAEFVRIVASDITEKTIEENLPLVQKRLDQVIAKRTEMIKKSVLARAGAEGSVEFAKALSEISKVGAAQRHGYVWDEKDFNRDPGTGRFRAKVSHKQSKPIDNRTANMIGIPEYTNRSGQKVKLTAQQRTQYQDEYRQLANFLATVSSSTRNPGDSDVVLRFRDKSTGQEHHQILNGTKAEPHELDPKRYDLLEIQARPGALTAGGAAFGLMGALGDKGSARAGGVSRTIDTVDREASSFSSQWSADTNPRNSSERTFNRIKAGSNLAYAMAPDGSQMQMAAAFGQFVGNVGPEAEKVFGPSARKTAYRYRGTEKTPDKAMVSVYERALSQTKMREDTGNRNLAPVQMAAVRENAKRRPTTFAERADGRAVVLQQLQNKMPDKRLYELQLQSGNTPPSEGVIIDKDGKIVTQAIGYGDDHYVPFNLKNLKGLKGGEYIRSRSVGGLTSEDIYLGLMSGARQVTVTSRSGTFTMTFEEDFKGRRRHNDKARRMTRRYEQILDAVQSEQVDRKDISPAMRNQITTEVREEMAPYGFDRKTMRDEVNRRVQAYKSDPEISDEDLQRAEAIINARTANGTSPDAAKIRSQVMNDLVEEKETKFRLNGIGYAAALNALREQFPYYITVDYKPTKEVDRVEPEKDKGYVEPGRNRPTAANAGMFGTSVNPGSKFISASQTDYQGYRAQSRGGTADGSGAAPRATSGGSLTPAPEKKSEAVAAAVHEAKVNADFTKAADEAREIISANFDIENDVEGKRIMAYSNDDLKDPRKAAEFDKFVLGKYREARAAGDKAPRQVTNADLIRYQSAAGHVGQQSYPTDRAPEWGEKPYKFEGKAYAGNDQNAKRQEIYKLEQSYPATLTGDKKLSAMSDDELRTELSMVNAMTDALKAGDVDTVTTVLRQEGEDVNPAAARGIASMGPEKAVETIHRMRAAKVGYQPQESGPKDDGITRNRLDPGSGAEKRERQSKVSDSLEFLRANANFLEESDDPVDEENARKLHDFTDAAEAHVQSSRGGTQDLVDYPGFKEALELAGRANQRRQEKRRSDGLPSQILRYDGDR